MPLVYGLIDVADVVGASRQTVWSRYRKGLMLQPEYRTPTGAPFWSEEQLEIIATTWVADLRVRD